ncbi:metallophosphoesterase [Microbacterium sp. NPDC059771]|uniref:metallophosphoesterase n=1 Tax=Microbacterium sp. NPDC059771 TaxID=3346941 RepID=UPI00364C327F
MSLLDTAAMMDLPDTRVAVCGDWHGNVGWVRTLAPAIGRLAPDVTTILQVGDWWMDTELTDPVFLDAGIERVLVTLGNHEPWPLVVRALDVAPEEAVQISEVTWLLPRPYRFQVGGRQILSLGGATSVDRLWRVPGREWWAEEAITDEHVDAAIAGGPADVMLTHESPARTSVRAVRRMLSRNPAGFPGRGSAGVGGIPGARHPRVGRRASGGSVSRAHACPRCQRHGR